MAVARPDASRLSRRRAATTPQWDRTQGAITASSVGLTVAPAARADVVVVAAAVIVSLCRSGRRLNAMTTTPMIATARAITGGGGTLAGLFMVGYLIAILPEDKGL
jgi:hypothetical protein